VVHSFHGGMLLVCQKITDNAYGILQGTMNVSDVPRFQFQNLSGDVGKSFETRSMSFARPSTTLTLFG
jgi:hypothetical protein